MHINFIRHATVQTSRCFYVKQKNDIFPVHFCFTLEFLLPTNYPRESATSFFSPHLPTWVGSTHGLWVSGFKKDTSTRDGVTDHGVTARDCVTDHGVTGHGVTEHGRSQWRFIYLFIYLDIQRRPQDNQWLFLSR